MKKLITLLIAITAAMGCRADDIDAARTKVWWFFGDTTITKEGIIADVEAFKQAGIGGVVYYDQIHGKGKAAPTVFSQQWWNDLKFAAQTATAAGLTFEINISNGYVAGGPWITPDLGMQMLRRSEIIIDKASSQKEWRLPAPRGSIHDVVVLAFKDNKIGKYLLKDNFADCGKTVSVSSITYNLKPCSKGKARTSAMNEPGPPAKEFYGTNYIHLDPPCQLQCSNDGKTWTKVCDLQPTRKGMSTFTNEITLCFPETTARYFRLKFPDNGMFKPEDIKEAWLSERKLTTHWQKKAAFHSEFIDIDDYTDNISECIGFDGNQRSLGEKARAFGGDTRSLGEKSKAFGGDNRNLGDMARSFGDIIDLNEIIDITDKLHGDTLRWTPPTDGSWRVMRIGYGPTNMKLKHGRPGMQGLQCDNMSVEAVTAQWNNYVRPICDTLAAIGCRPSGVAIDSHEAGPQNWTKGFDKKFQTLRGYSLSKYLPALFGYIVGSKAQTENFLYDYRRTCADLISRDFFGALDSMARHDGLTLTAQAIGNGLSITGDNLQAKGRVAIPQGEFWAYQTNGNYDVKEASSAAHMYGKNIASAEAFTDAGYDKTPEDLKRIADLAFVFGINEFVVCAVPAQPWTAPHPGYLTGGKREYGINRSNKWWNTSRWFWDYQARTAAMLRKGQPIVDIALFLGSDAPVKILANKVPQIPDGYDFDAFTGDALKMMTAQQGRAVMPCGMSYAAIVMANDTRLSKEDSTLLRKLQQQGVPVIGLESRHSPTLASASTLASTSTPASASTPTSASTLAPTSTLASALRDAGIAPDCEFHREPKASSNVYDDRLYFCHRRNGNEEIYFIVNHSPQPYDGIISLRANTDKALKMNPINGKTEQIKSNAQGLPLKLKPYESAFIILAD